MESSETSNDEEETKLRSAVDHSFTLDLNQKKNETQESKRFKQNLDWDSGHSLQTYNIGVGAQKCIAKQLSESLERQIKLVYRKKRTELGHEENGYNNGQGDAGIYLFSNSKAPVTSTSLENGTHTNDQSVRKKPCIKKRKVDETDSEDESTKLESVAVSYDWVISSQY